MIIIIKFDNYNTYYTILRLIYMIQFIRIKKYMYLTMFYIVINIEKHGVIIFTAL